MNNDRVKEIESGGWEAKDCYSRILLDVLFISETHEFDADQIDRVADAPQWARLYAAYKARGGGE